MREPRSESVVAVSEWVAESKLWGVLEAEMVYSTQLEAGVSVAEMVMPDPATKLTAGRSPTSAPSLYQPTNSADADTRESTHSTTKRKMKAKSASHTNFISRSPSVHAPGPGTRCL